MIKNIHIDRIFDKMQSESVVASGWDDDYNDERYHDSYHDHYDDRYDDYDDNKYHDAT